MWESTFLQPIKETFKVMPSPAVFGAISGQRVMGLNESVRLFCILWVKLLNVSGFPLTRFWFVSIQNSSPCPQKQSWKAQAAGHGQMCKMDEFQLWTFSCFSLNFTLFLPGFQTMPRKIEKEEPYFSFPKMPFFFSISYATKYRKLQFILILNNTY